MDAGNLAVGAKLTFMAEFSSKPTGTGYRLKNIDSYITFSTRHNFVRDMPDSCFGPSGSLWSGGVLPQQEVKIFVTVKKAGRGGECSVDIINWE